MAAKTMDEGLLLRSFRDALLAFGEAHGKSAEVAASIEADTTLSAYLRAGGVVSGDGPAAAPSSGDESDGAAPHADDVLETLRPEDFAIGGRGDGGDAYAAAFERWDAGAAGAGARKRPRVAVDGGGGASATAGAADAAADHGAAGAGSAGDAPAGDAPAGDSALAGVHELLRRRRVEVMAWERTAGGAAGEQPDAAVT